MTTADRVMVLILVLAAPAVNLYPILYAFRPWRTTPQGRALMVKALGNVIVVDVVLAYLLFGDYPLRDPVRITGFGLFAVGVWALLISLIAAPGSGKYPPLSWWRRSR